MPRRLICARDAAALTLQLAALLVGCAAARPATGVVLLGLKPASGPRDGGTRVLLDVLGLNRSLPVLVQLRGIQRGGNEGGAMVQMQVEVEREASGEEEEPHFVVPDMTRKRAGAGLMVTVVARQGHNILAGPVFFRLSDPLAKLAPAFVSPCCSFDLSGGQVLMLSGFSAEAAPAADALVRFSGSQHTATVAGQVVQGDWDVADVSKHAVDQTWHLYAVTPPWPRAEQGVAMEVSWNEQQFARYDQPLAFTEERSFFGSVVDKISEDHLLDGKAQGEKFSGKYSHGADGDGERVTEEVTVVEPGGGSSGKEGARHGGVQDVSEAMLLDKLGDAFILARSGDLTHLAEDVRFVRDLFILTCAASVGGGVMALAGEPSIIGFMLGGIVVGPGCLDQVVELVQLESMAQLGVLFLMFSIGLELSVEKLRSNVRASLAALVAMALLCGLVVAFAVLVTRTKPFEALCIGVFASLASTPVSLKAVSPEPPAAPPSGYAIAAALGETAPSPETDARFEASAPDASPHKASRPTSDEAGQLLAILVTQDVILAGFLALMPVLFAPRDKVEPEPAHEESSIGFDLYTRFVAGAAAVILGAVALGPACRLRRGAAVAARGAYVAVGRRVRELDAEVFLLFSVSYAFVCSWLTNRLGLSAELGAFVGGFVLTACSEKAGERCEHALRGLRDIFVAWFFASIGLVVNPRFLLDNLPWMLCVAAGVFALKLFTGFLPLWALSRRRSRRPAFEALRTSWVLSHVSEFGFVLASKGAGWGVLSRHAYLLLVGTNTLSLCLAPWLFRARDRLFPIVGQECARPAQDSAPPPQAVGRAADEASCEEEVLRVE